MEPGEEARMADTQRPSLLLAILGGSSGKRNAVILVGDPGPMNLLCSCQ
jgi:hypothetical protein